MEIVCQGLHATARGEGPAVVMLHGGMGVRSVCEPYVAALGETVQVILPDCRGCGASVSRDPSLLTWDRLADDVALLLDHVGAEQAVVGGVSGGSGVALRFALRHPKRLRGLVLALPVYRGAALGYTPFQAAQFALLAGLHARVAAEGARAFAPMFQAMAGERAEAFAAGFAATHDALSVAGWGDFMAAGSQPFADLPDLQTIAAPVLIIPGADEMHERAIAEAYRRAMPQAQWCEGDAQAVAQAIAALVAKA